MMRKFRLFGVLLLVLALFPVRSYAVDFWPNGSYWNGITSPGHYAAFVRADDIYGAAAYGLNKDPASLSSDVRLKLSDPNYGGKFYEYAQTFYNVEGWPNMPEWVPTYVLATSVGLGQSFERVYASEVTTTLRDEALRDFERVLAGEDLSGGGGSGGDVSGYSVLPLSSGRVDLHYAFGDVDCTFYNASVSDDGSVVLTGGTGEFSPVVDSSKYVSSVRVYVSPSVKSYLQSVGKEYCFFVIVNPMDNNCRVGFIYGDSISVVRRTVTVNGLSSTRDFIEGENLYRWNPADALRAYHDSEGVFFVLPDSPVSGVFSISSNDPGYYSSFISPPSPPGGDWPEPETPVTPTAPEIPTPTAPTVTPDPEPTQPTPTWPDITINIPAAPTVAVTPTGLDYTELLTRINDNLNSINSYSVSINNNLNSLRSDLVTEFDGVTQGLRNIYQYLQHLDDLLERHCKHLRDALDNGIYNLELYIKSLFEWLPQQLDFDANFDYDDSGIKSYLQRILNKIPGGATGTPQTYMPNPQSDEPGFLDWLTDLWHRFLIDLVSVLPDELGGLVDAFSQLTHYFPFSIPWDLAALLALFEHEPVTPVFDVPWGFGGDEGEIQMVRVDLSAWDGVMEMVRPVFLVGFCWQLAMITKDLLANFDINKGGV